MKVTPFQIAVEQSVLDDLRARLERTRLAEEPGGAGWGYGTNAGYLRELVDHWVTSFDWRKQEQRLNEAGKPLLNNENVRTGDPRGDAKPLAKGIRIHLLAGPEIRGAEIRKQIQNPDPRTWRGAVLNQEGDYRLTS